MGALKQPKVILLSVDGLRADLCCRKTANTPAFNWLTMNGLTAKSAAPVYPTVTFTNHASIATGVASARHGIYGNTRFSTSNGEFRDWYMNIDAFKAPTVWDQARIAGCSTTLLRWPITNGAKVSVNVPEVFDATSDDEMKTWLLTLEHSTPWLMKTMQRKAQITEPRTRRDYDAWLTDTLLHIIEFEPTDLIMAHFVELDHAQHNHGCKSQQANEALKFTDSLLTRIIAAIDSRKTSLLVFGDHGMTDFDKRFSINAFFAQRGWIKVKNGIIHDWRALAHINCGQAAVYAKDPFIEREIVKTLSEHAEGKFEILDRALLDKLGAFPGAVCAVDCLPGYSMSENLEGDIFAQLNHARGEHGHGFRLDHPNMQAGFLAVGPSFAAASKIDSISLTDIAPLTASLLGFNMPLHNEKLQFVRTSRI